MGIIGEELLKRIADAEREGNWDMVVDLLAMAQLNATKNYIELIQKESKAVQDD